MNYRSISDLNEDIIKWIPKLPRNIELVVGIPRSGLLVANLLSLHLNIPMTDLDGFLAGRILSSGGRLRNIEKDSFLTTSRSVLIVDDSICTERQIEETQNLIKEIKQHHTLTYAALYVATYDQLHKYRYSYMRLPLPRIFEWNIFHHSLLQNACVDIDGVLCPDPHEAENDDGDIYLNYLRAVKPIRVPTFPIGFLVTCRLEKYRSLTIDWLNQNAIRYHQLFMMDYPDKRSRQQEGLYSFYKANIYKSTHADMFIESSQAQAEEIARLAGKYVYCASTHILIPPPFLGRVTEKFNEQVKKTRLYPVQRIKALLKLIRWWILKK